MGRDRQRKRHLSKNGGPQRVETVEHSLYKHDAQLEHCLQQQRSARLEHGTASKAETSLTLQDLCFLKILTSTGELTSCITLACLLSNTLVLSTKLVLAIT